MTDQQRKPLDPDDQFARLLEERHKQLVAADPDATSNMPAVAASRVDAAVHVLELIQEVKVHQDKAGHARQDTRVEISTDRGHAAGPPLALPDLEMIGRFKIVEQVGRGGYGIVVRAHDSKLNRDVAIKIPRLESALTAESRQRFAREAKAAASLDHPNIVTVYENGHDQGIDYLVAQFVEGEDLATFLARGQKLAHRQAAELVSQLADALEHAHQRGVLHRDLKPGNILLEKVEKGSGYFDEITSSEQPASGAEKTSLTPFFPKITDFGLAAILDEARDLTQTGSVLGTPAYMSPEQAAGDKRWIGPPTDVYGLGTVLYQLLTGAPPFSGRSLVDTIRAICDRDPESPRQIDTAIARDLEAVCLKCLEKKPVNRYPSARELQADLQRFLDGKPVTARSITGGDRVVRWARRNPALATASAAAVVFLVAALVATSIGWVSTSSALRRESSALERESHARKQARSAVNDFYTEVAENQLLNVPGLTPLRHTLLQMALAYYQGFLSGGGDDEELLLEIEQAHFRVGKILKELGRPIEALEAFQNSIAAQDQQLEVEPDNPETLIRQMISLHHVADVFVALGDFDEATPRVDQAIDGFRVLRIDDAENVELAQAFSNALQTKAGILKETGKAEESAVVLRETRDIRQLLVAVQPENAELNRRYAGNLGDLANSIAARGNLDEASVLLDEAIGIYRVLMLQSGGHPEDKDGLHKSLYNRATKHLAKGEFADARRLLEEAVRHNSELCLQFPNMAQYQLGRATVTNGMGFCYARLNMVDQAIEAFAANTNALEQVVQIYPDVANHNMDLALSKLNLASVLAQVRDDHERARQHLHEAIDIFNELQEQNPQLLNARIGLALATVNLSGSYNNADEFPEALKHADRSIELLEVLDAENPNHPQIKPNIPLGYKNRGAALENLDRYAESIAAWERVIQLAPSRQATETQLRLAAVNAMADNASQARELIDSVTQNEDALQKSPFHLGRSQALLVAAWIRLGNQEQAVIDEMARLAVQSLELARQQGKFDKPSRITALDKDEFDGIRDRDDFKDFLQRVVDDRQ